MKKVAKIIMALMFSMLSLLLLMCSIAAAEEEDNSNLLQTDGFYLDEEFLKALSSPYTEDFRGKKIDANNDGILSMEELSNITILYLWCSDCQINDWSGLELFENIEHLYIDAADFDKVNFVDYQNSKIKIIALLDSCKNFQSVSGLENFNNVEELIIYSNETISYKYFIGLNGKTLLSIKAPEVTDMDLMGSFNTILETPEPTATPLDTSRDSTGITIEGEEKITAYVGDKLTFKVHFTPEGTWGIVSWLTDKRSIGSFSNSDHDYNESSELTLWKSGTITVTAKSLHTRRDSTQYYLTDTVVVEVLDPIPSKTPEPILVGDVNADEKVNAEDALLVLKHAAKIELLKDEFIESADVCEDSKVDAKDALEILKIAAKITE